ncbi:MAG: imidazole glycerol phosphate synthase subunit HisF [Myxococcales bacterium FL481]|nr:MAG: imidazole glycerol phosphate synthase subunit HisF [Myxococcales bacterium FL481]
MLKRRIIPRLDIRDGRVVKGVHFRGMRDPEDAVEAARMYDRQGADELCLINVSDTEDGRRHFSDVVRRVAPQVFVPITAGGGVRREKDVRLLLQGGADKVIVNSAVVSSPALIARLSHAFGRQSIVVGVDARRMDPVVEGRAADYEVVVHGRSRSTGLDVVWWCEQVDQLGAGEILLTSVDAEETKSGYDVEITRAVARAVGIPVIASGGLSNLDHLLGGLAVGQGEADAVLGAAIFHFGLYTIEQAKEFLHERGVPVRRLPSRAA